MLRGNEKPVVYSQSYNFFILFPKNRGTDQKIQQWGNKYDSALFKVNLLV